MEQFLDPLFQHKIEEIKEKSLIQKLIPNFLDKVKNNLTVAVGFELIILFKKEMKRQNYFKIGNH